MFCYIAFILLLSLHLCANEKLTDAKKIESNDPGVCTKANKKDAGESSCIGKNLEYPISAEELDLLKANSLAVNTQACSSNPAQICLSVDRESLIGAGSYGMVVRGQSKSVHFPVAIKFMKPTAKLDSVSFSTTGRYNRIDLDSLISNRGSQKSLREAVALRLITEYEIPSIPKYVAYFETSSYRVLAMELLDGYEELSKIIDSLSAKDLLSVSCQTAVIVCNLDRISVSHDDMHERNLLVDRKNNKKVNLIDFGGAQFVGQQKHFTSASNFLKQPINLFGHLRRNIKEDIIDRIQSQEKKTLGQFCTMMEKITTAKTDEEKEAIPYYYRVLFEKYWKISQTNKKLFKCTLIK